MTGLLVFWDCTALMAEQDCLSAWLQNPVSQSCRAYVSATASDRATPMLIDLDNGQCRMTLTCKNWYGAGTPNLSLEIEKSELKNIHNCNGELQVVPCQGDQPDQGQ
jgi:hypothetical protein